MMLFINSDFVWHINIKRKRVYSNTNTQWDIFNIQEKLLHKDYRS